MTDKMTVAELNAARAKKAGVQRVMGAVRFEYDGHRFDSKREAKRWAELSLMQRAGHISNLERQVKIPLEGQGAPILTDSGAQQRVYVADFKYFDTRAQAWVIEDAKGHPTEVYKLKRAIVQAMGLTIKEV